MKEKWETLLAALIFAVVTTVFAVIQQYRAFGDEVFVGMLSSIGLLTWGGGFCIATIVFFVAIDLVKRWNKRKK